MGVAGLALAGGRAGRRLGDVGRCVMGEHFQMWIMPRGGLGKKEREMESWE